MATWKAPLRDEVTLPQLRVGRVTVTNPSSMLRLPLRASSTTSTQQPRMSSVWAPLLAARRHRALQCTRSTLPVLLGPPILRLVLPNRHILTPALLLLLTLLRTMGSLSQLVSLRLTWAPVLINLALPATRQGRRRA